MSLLDRLVEEVLSRNRELSALQPVIEKELLHHDILNVLSQLGHLHRLTFIGGTCLRTCFGSPRLSEDLDFYGGRQFDRNQLDRLGSAVPAAIAERYGFKVEVTEPQRETGNTVTWRIRVVTRPEQPHMPIQRINIDVCALPAYDSRPALLRNPYGIDLGTSGLILQAASREEILADKWVALALRPNRIKQRDLWDIVWLGQNAVELRPDLVRRKLADRERGPQEFLSLLNERVVQLEHSDFLHEINRFLPQETVNSMLSQPEYWQVVLDALRAGCASLETAFRE